MTGVEALAMPGRNANEAQQLSAPGQPLGRPLIGGAFAASLQVDAVSAALGRYES